MNLNIQIQYFDNVSSVDVVDANTEAKDWRTYVVPKFLKTPVITQSKLNAEAFVTAVFKENSKRSASNVVAYTAIVLDIDDDYSIKDFEDAHSHLEYLLYTTYSHGPAKDKFRVIIPLEKSIGIEFFVAAKEVLKDLFPFSDKAAFTPSQCFLLPCTTAANFDFAYSSHNEGQLFDFGALEDEVRYRSIINMVNRVKRMNDKKKRAIQLKMNANGGGSRLTGQGDTLEDAKRVIDKMSRTMEYADWMRVGMALKTIYGEEGFNVWHEYTMEAKQAKKYPTEEIVRKKWNTFSANGKITDFGFFVNIAKENPREVSDT